MTLMYERGGETRAIVYQSVSIHYRFSSKNPGVTFCESPLIRTSFGTDMSSVLFIPCSLEH